MKPERAIEELRTLRQSAIDDSQIRANTPQHEAWKASVDAVMLRSLGADSRTLKSFRDVHYSAMVFVIDQYDPSQDAGHFAEGMGLAIGFVDAAIYELGLQLKDDPDASAYDEELWAHVRHSVDEERWDQVASAAATFDEDKIRRWSGDPRDEKGGRMVGQGLFAKALGDGGVLVLGGQANETVGWRNLGIGFASALSNVDRHNIQDRPDLKQYALGVLGLASLLLTQIKFEHADVVKATDRSR